LNLSKNLRITFKFCTDFGKNIYFHPAQIDIPYINSLYLHPVVLQKIYFSFYLLTEERVYFLKGEEESIFLKGDNSSMIHDIILR
jgi:hypothetical protein